MTIADDPASPSTDHSTFLEDYERLRTDAAAVALRRDVLHVAGPDAVDYLQGQLSQDVAALGVGESAHSLLLTPQGKLDALVRVTRTGDEDMVIDVDGGHGEAVAARLARFKLRVKVVIEPLPWRCIALRGPRVAALETAGTATLTPAFSWNGVAGVDLLGESPHVPDGVPVAVVEAWESVRVEAGIPVMGSELDERTIAAEADLLDRCVSFTKGCYTGQELVARLDARGNRVARHLRGLVVVGLGAGATGGPDRGPAATVVAPGSEIVAEGKVVGTVTSSTWSPTFDCPVALAYVHRAVVPPATVELHVVGGDTVDGAPLSAVVAEVRTLPLV